MIAINETHDAALKSWVESANNGTTDFPIQNLPFASFRRQDSDEYFRGGVAIGDMVLDLAQLAEKELFIGLAQEALYAAADGQLNEFMDMGQETWSALRLALSKALRVGAADQELIATCLISMDDVEYAMPCTVFDYTDFYTSIYHATAVGSLFRPDNPLLPNYKWVPIGYHGRASSIDISGQQFHRPNGQTKAPDAAEPSFGPCKRLDYELEMGIFIGKSNKLGAPVSIADAENHVFGMCILNDWSARDIQAWEYQPLGPFLAKNFASTISPWIVTMEALAPYRESFTRDAADPQPMAYLSSDENSQSGAIDIQLECFIETTKMRETNTEIHKLSESSFKHSYWTIGQMVTHHTVNGCNMQAGDLLGSGTQSGPQEEEAGSLLELTNGGKRTINLSNGEERKFLEDGDAIIMRGHCARDGFARIGFGEVVGTILPART